MGVFVGHPLADRAARELALVNPSTAIAPDPRAEGFSQLTTIDAPLDGLGGWCGLTFSKTDGSIVRLTAVGAKSGWANATKPLGLLRQVFQEVKLHLVCIVPPCCRDFCCFAMLLTTFADSKRCVGRRLLTVITSTMRRTLASKSYLFLELGMNSIPSPGTKHWLTMTWPPGEKSA
jgi:hypothetical protein